MRNSATSSDRRIYFELQTALTSAQAALVNLEYRVRTGELIEIAELERTTIARAHRVRDRLTTAPGRHAALLAAELGLDAGALAATLEAFVHHFLTAAAPPFEHAPHGFSERKRRRGGRPAGIATKHYAGITP